MAIMSHHLFLLDKEPFQISCHHSNVSPAPAFKDSDCSQAASLPVGQIVCGLQGEASLAQVSLEEAVVPVL